MAQKGGFGGVIKLTGESEYRRALTNIINSQKLMVAEMKMLSTSFDSGDITMKEYASGLSDLSKGFIGSKTALKSYSEQLAELVKKQRENEEETSKLLKELEKEENLLDDFATKMGKTSKAYKDQEKVVHDLNNKYNDAVKTLNANDRAITKLETDYAKAKTTSNEASKAIKELGVASKTAGDDASKGSEGFTVFKGVLANLTTSAINGAINGFKSISSIAIDLGKNVIFSNAEYEKASKGVETIFKDSATKVKQYAESAYKSAGISAIDYLNQANTFSARLIRDLGNDTSKAVDLVDMAIKDMADNSAMTGADLRDIQNAYESMARGNAQLLDNLRLGYGGTKTEALQLAKDMGIVNSSVKSFSDMSFEDVILSIHKMQEELQITGASARGSTDTISGSFTALKANWENFLLALGDPEGNITTATNNLTDSFLVVGENIQPILDEVLNNLPKIAENIENNVIPKLEDAFPQLESVNGILSATIDNLQWAVDNSGTIKGAFEAMAVGIGVAVAQAQPLATALAGIMFALATINGSSEEAQQKMSDGLVTGANTQSGFGGFFDAIDTLVGKTDEVKVEMSTKGEEIGGGFVDSMGNEISKDIYREKVYDASKPIGGGMMDGLYQGWKEQYPIVSARLEKDAMELVNNVKAKYKIHSPSKVFADEIGKYLAQGLGMGFTNEMSSVTKQMQNSIPTTFDVDMNTNSNNPNILTVNAFKQALSEMKIELDDSEVGSFVDKTVTRLVYS